MNEQIRRKVEKIGDSIFLSPAFQALTIGIPFCIFKLLFGLLALRSGAPSGPLVALAWLVMVWAVADLIMNLARVVFHLAGREAPVESGSECTPEAGWGVSERIMFKVPSLRIGDTQELAPERLQYCTIAQAGLLFGRPRLFLAIDTLLSFSIICFVLWSGWIKLLEVRETYFWYAATTLNLISVSVVNIWIELRRGR